jgi:hypothetical protein
MQPPPIRIDVSQRTVLGFNYRQIIILAIAGFLALAAFAGLKAAPLFVRGALPVLLAGLGVALAFGEINGKTPEAWLLDWLAFGRRPRYLLHRAIREKDARRVVLPDENSSAEITEAKTPSTPVKATSPARSFFILSANAIALSMIVGLTLYLLDGGAERLIRMWWGL